MIEVVFTLNVRKNDKFYIDVKKTSVWYISTIYILYETSNVIRFYIVHAKCKLRLATSTNKRTSSNLWKYGQIF